MHARLRLPPALGAVVGIVLLAWLGCVNLTPPPEIANCPGPSCPDASRGNLDAVGDGPGDADMAVLVDANPDPVGVQLGNGQPCVRAEACASGFCVDGFCCNQACGDPCVSCALAGSMGVCTPVPAGADPHDDCSSQPADTCGRDGMCDGKGGCRLFEAGTACGASTCTAAVETSARQCDGMGACRAGQPKPCEPYACGDGRCAGACKSDGDCGTGFFCAQEMCTALRSNGMACTAGTQCESRFCVDGVCCGTACGQACHSCNLEGTRGVCTPVPSGEDPQDECTTDPASSCAHDGFCDGRGGCRLYPAGTECAPRACAAGTEYLPRTCDGLGVCRQAATKACAPYVCGGTSCATTCSGPEGCGAGSLCDQGKCTGLMAAGAACTAGNQCVSGFCVDGVCCQTACGETCHACNLPGSPGTCSPVPAGEDPGNECSQDAAGTCGRDGTCDGRGACRVHAAGTVCALAGCSNGTETSTRTCDGAGTCRPATATPCAPYVCAGASCATTCSGHGDCQSDHYCEGTCKRKLGLGAICGGGAQCTSGHCVDGVCCDGACSGTCVTCNLGGSSGLCTPVPAGQDPRSACAATPASGCGQDGACDGAGACRLYTAGTVCVAQTCTNDVSTSARTCDGAGTCRPATTTACAPYRCGGAACATTCSQASDCQTGYTCTSGFCRRLPALMVTGTLTAEDMVMQARLEALGFSVVNKATWAVATADATGKSLVVVTESGNSSEIGTKLTSVSVPVLVIEAYFLDNMGMTGATGTVDHDSATGNSVVMLGTAHPLSAGLGAGTQAVSTMTGDLHWGLPLANAIKIATIPGSTTRMAIFGYEKGAQLSGLTAPARRVSFFAGDKVLSSLTTTGRALLDAAILWLVGN